MVGFQVTVAVLVPAAEDGAPGNEHVYGKLSVVLAATDAGAPPVMLQVPFVSLKASFSETAIASQSFGLANVIVPATDQLPSVTVTVYFKENVPEFSTGEAGPVFVIPWLKLPCAVLLIVSGLAPHSFTLAPDVCPMPVRPVAAVFG